MMAVEGTFDYVATIPGSLVDGCFECRATTREPVARTGDDRRDSRLVGPGPSIRVAASGSAAGAHPGRPRVGRSRITLAALDRRLSAVSEAAFHVDRALTDAFRAGDELHIVRTSVGGLGLSVIRDGALVAAIGGVTAVRLGRGVVARIPRRLIEDAEAAIREDADVDLPQLPVEVIVGDAQSLLYRGHRTLEAYDVDVVHGLRVGLPGRQECCAIYDRRTCPDIAATASAMLMDDGHSLTMRRW